MWFLFASFSAILASFELLSRKYIGKKSDGDAISLSAALYAFPVYASILFISGIPAIGSNYWWALLIHVAIDFVTYSMLNKALSKGDISLVAPLLAFSSIVIVISSPLIIHEIPSIVGIFGVLVIVIGAYLLNVSLSAKGLLAPLKSLATTSSSRLAIGIGLLWGISSQIVKIAQDNSSPFFHLTIYSICLSITFVIKMLIIKPKAIGKRKILNKNLVALGLVTAGSLGFQALAYNFPGGLVAYVVSIKRLSLLLSTLYGWWFFKEKNIEQRLVGVVVMLVGVVLVALWG